MTELEKLQAEHTAMGETIVRLQAMANKAAEPNKAAMFVPSDDDSYFVIVTTSDGYEVSGHCYFKKPATPRFQTREHAEAIAFARSIEDQMRAQPGCVVAEHGKEQWVIRFSYGSFEPYPTGYEDLDEKLDHGQWGVFDTEENLEAAIRTVGAENIIRAAKAKVGIY